MLVVSHAAWASRLGHHDHSDVLHIVRTCCRQKIVSCSNQESGVAFELRPALPMAGPWKP